MSGVKKKSKRKLIRQKTGFCALAVWSVIGIFLIPVLGVSLLATIRLISQIPLISSTVLYLVVGILTYSIIHYFIYQPLVLYVLAHEFTHAIFAVLSGSHLKKIKVSHRGGYVELTQSNFVVDLAPYFFPLYSILLAIIFFSLNYFYHLEEYAGFFFFLLGLSLSFHYLSNWETLKIEQPDLKMTGKIFAGVFSMIMNLLFLNIILMFIFLDYVNLETILNNYIWAIKWLKLW